jgi:hypothetical protein
VGVPAFLDIRHSATTAFSKLAEQLNLSEQSGELQRCRVLTSRNSLADLQWA